MTRDRLIHSYLTASYLYGGQVRTAARRFDPSSAADTALALDSMPPTVVGRVRVIRAPGIRAAIAAFNSRAAERALYPDVIVVDGITPAGRIERREQAEAN